MDTILIIRLGAMGDILHALPAVASLKSSMTARIVWVVAPKWMPLLEGNPAVDEVLAFDRHGLANLKAAWTRLRAVKADVAIDFQGLIQSALVGRAAGARTFYGFSAADARERLACWLYTQRVRTSTRHVVDKNLELAGAAGANRIVFDSWIPEGRAEGVLPDGPFVLTNPFAGWAGKQWPIERYDALGERLRAEGIDLVANVPAARALELGESRHVKVHMSGLPGLIHASRRALAVVGLDSGPLHLAAALRKPGVALFGPTDPSRNGPYGGTMTVLRKNAADTTYKRDEEIHPSMRAIGVEEVSEALMESIAQHRVTAGREK